MEFCNWSMYCCALLCVHSSLAINLLGKRELVAFLSLSSWCLVIVVWLFLAVPRLCLQFVIVVFPDHTHFLFLSYLGNHYNVVKCIYPLLNNYTKPSSRIAPMPIKDLPLVNQIMIIYLPS